MGDDLLRFIGELKGAAMKVGQMLSLQDAFLPPEVGAVLRALQRVSPRYREGAGARS